MVGRSAFALEKVTVLVSVSHIRAHQAASYILTLFVQLGRSTCLVMVRLTKRESRVGYDGIVPAFIKRVTRKRVPASERIRHLI